MGSARPNCPRLTMMKTTTNKSILGLSSPGSTSTAPAVAHQGGGDKMLLVLKDAKYVPEKTL